MTRSSDRTAIRESANNSFIGENMVFDALMEQLKTLRAAHFQADADRERNWGEVGSLKHVNCLLRQALEHYGIRE